MHSSPKQPIAAQSSPEQPSAALEMLLKPKEKQRKRILDIATYASFTYGLLRKQQGILYFFAARMLHMKLQVWRRISELK